MRYKGRRRTLFSLMGALGLAASVFLYFQLFSVEMIDFHKRKSELSNSVKSHPKQADDDLNILHPGHGVDKKWDCDSPDCDNVDQRSNGKNKLSFDEYHNVVNGIADKAVDVKSQESHYSDIMKDLPHGVNMELASLYKHNNYNTFTCIHSKEVISTDWINDDYCDCADGSDEPGTSACIDNRFYCSFQGGMTKDIPSSRVNDGICDCCDGSDEWMNRSLPPQVKLDDKPHYGYYQAPCANHCEQEINHAKRVSDVHRQGAALKQEYIKVAMGQSNPGMLFGPNGEFLTLSKNCYEIKSDKYEYSVCPFKEIRQQSFPEPSILIGQVPEWIEQGENGDWLLVMSQGDAKQCPGAIKRKTVIQFECGVKDEVVSVQETEICQYRVVFVTPAAC